MKRLNTKIGSVNLDALKLSKRTRKMLMEDIAFIGCVRDLLEHDKIAEQSVYRHHGTIDCLSHSMYVAYTSYRIGRKLGTFMELDTRMMARGGLLHDFYLYDWHVKGDRKGLHGFTHPKTALRNAKKYFRLSEKEEDVVLKHMWPLIPYFPKYKESYIVMVTDKYCTLMESIRKN